MKNRSILIFVGILVISGIQACNSPKNIPSNPSPQAPTATPTNYTPGTTLTVTGTSTITCSFTPTATLIGTTASTNTPTTTPTLTSAVTPVPTHTELVTSTLTNTSTWTATETTTLTPTPTITSTPTPTASPMGMATATPTFHLDAKWINLASAGGLATQGTTAYSSTVDPVGVEVFDQSTDFSNPTTIWVPFGTSILESIYHSFSTVAVNRTNGTIYALDTDTNEIWQFFTSGGPPVPFNGNFEDLTDIQTDSNGNYYVVDYLAAEVYEFNSSNVQLNQWTKAGNTPLVSPTSVALDSANNIYIADAGTQSIYELSASGGNTLVGSWSLPGGADIFQMAVNDSGVIYATDDYLSQLEEFVPGTSTMQNAWNGTQGGGTQFGELYGVVLLSNGNILTSANDLNGDAMIEEFYP